MTDHVSCSPDWFWHSDSNGWHGYHIWCVEKGTAEITVKDERYLLYPGDFFLFDLNDNHICTHHPDNPLSVFTVYFDCSGFSFKKRLMRQNSLLNLSVKQIYFCMENLQ